MPPAPVSNVDEQGDISQLRALMDSPYILDSSQATETIGRLGDTRAVRALIRIINESADHKYVGGYFEDQRRAILRHSVQLLAQIGIPAADPLVVDLKKAMSKRSTLAAEHEIEALGTIGDGRATGILAAVLKNKNHGLHSFAIKALGDIGGPTAVKPLLRAVNKGARAKWQGGTKDRERIETATRAARALGEIGDRGAVKPLIRAFKMADSVMARDMAPALEALGEAATLERLGWHKGSLGLWSKEH
jgi:HEAT repeat protein